MYSFPSTSQILPPAARSTKKGSPPTLRSARTGELTPPGMHLCALAKSLDEREVIGTQKTSNAQRSTPNIQFRSRRLPENELTTMRMEPARPSDLDKARQGHLPF